MRAAMESQPGYMRPNPRRWVYSAGERPCALCGRIIPRGITHLAIGRVPTMKHLCERETQGS